MVKKSPIRSARSSSGSMRNSGLAWRSATALLAILQRTPDLDLRMFVTAVLIQRETGGNLTEVLERLSTLMREREGFRGDLETLTAESKLSARILGCAAVCRVCGDPCNESALDGARAGDARRDAGRCWPP